LRASLGPSLYQVRVGCVAVVMPAFGLFPVE